MTSAAAEIAAETAARAAEVMALAAREVESGLPNERTRLDEARTNLDFYQGQGELHLPRRPDEDPEDFRDRPKRCSLLLQRVADVLAQHLYAPGPARDFSALPAEVSEWLAGAYQGADVNATMASADLHATVNDVALIQVCATGDPARPVRLHLWDSSEFAAWVDPEDPARPLVVCTIDRFDAQTRYRLYSAEEVQVWATRRLMPGQTSGGRVAHLESIEGNPLGVLPFVTIPYRHASGFWEVAGPGEAVRKANACLDVMLSNLGQAIERHQFPLGIATNVDPNWKPLFRPGGFTNVPADHTVDAGGTIAQSSLSYLQANVQVESTWEDVNSFISHVLAMAGVPESAVRLVQSGAASGRAIIAEQAPLLARATQRQPLAARWESELARVILAVGGYSEDRADLREAAADPKLTLSWPRPESPIPDPEDDARDLGEIAEGIASPITVLMRRRRITRDQAVQLLRQVAEDRVTLAELGLAPAPAPASNPNPSETD